MINHKWLGLIVVMMMVGCSTTPTTHYVTMDPNWISECHYAEPPEVEAYRNATLEQRLEMMTQTYLRSLQYAGECNVRLRQASDYNTKYLKMEVQDE